MCKLYLRLRWLKIVSVHYFLGNQICLVPRIVCVCFLGDWQALVSRIQNHGHQESFLVSFIPQILQHVLLLHQLLYLFALEYLSCLGSLIFEEGAVLGNGIFAQFWLYFSHRADFVKSWGWISDLEEVLVKRFNTFLNVNLWNLSI